jgi:amino-acid N-acetyltransferase
MHIAPEPISQELIALLELCELPVADISPTSSVQFFGVRSAGTLVAVVGLELHRPVGLLRSLAVAPSHRGRGVARSLVAFAEAYALSHGANTLFLLTTTAERLFLALGYLPTSRDAAPAPIQATSQFASLCPASSAFLSKHVAAAG